VVWPPDGPVGLDLGKRARTPEFEAFQPVDEQMGHHERIRLLYVACTRAQDHLVVSLHRKARNAADDQKRTNAELLAGACMDAPGQTALDPEEPAVVLPPGEDDPGSGDLVPPMRRWAEERRDVLRSSSRHRSLAASEVVLRGQEATDAGNEKGPRDLDLPAWQKGRYGHAIGRAVHAVLQTIDLETGDGIEEAADGQAAAEGILGRERDIVFLARSALSSPAVRESLQYPRWRETYVGTVIGDTTFEGYIDLMYRTPDGLVLVDYKTASGSEDLDLRAAHYRGQGATYALAVEQATGEEVTDVVLIFLTPDGPMDRVLPDLAGSKQAVRVEATDHRTSLDPSGQSRNRPTQGNRGTAGRDPRGRG
jgi:ATP-dependent helicase/nuclease subunit A